MYNLLSYQPGTVFTGAEIKEWAQQTFFTTKDIEKKRIAKFVLNHYANLRDNKKYAFYLRFRCDDPQQPIISIFTAVV